jgi:magnesium transporter
MIRSLVLAPDAIASIDAIAADPAFLRRNLTQENLEKCLAEGYNVWIDIVSPEAKEIHWLEGLLQLSSHVVEDLLREDHYPTLLVYPRYLFLSLFQPYVPSNGNGIIGREIHCIIGDHFCVTVRQADVSAVEAAYERVAQNPASWPRGVVFFLYLTAQHVIDTYYPLLDRISNQLNELEEKLLNEGDDKQIQKSVYRIKQHLIGLRRMIAPQREVLSNLMGDERIAADADIQDLFRHLYGRLLGIYDLIDSQRELTNNVLDIVAHQQSHKVGQAVNRLTIISMVFLPFTFFVGLFDSNFFIVNKTVILPINGLVISVIITMLMIASVAVMRMIFHRRDWV